MNRAAQRLATLAVALILSAAAGRAADAPPATAPHTFRYAPPAAAMTVVVAGDFNGWSTTANPMTRGADGAYTATIQMPVGRHQYKFVADNNWTQDPAADAKLDAPDGQGGTNSGVDVTAATATAATTAPAVSAPAAAGTVPHAFRYAPPAGDAPATVALAGDFNGWSTTANPMTRTADGSYAATAHLTPGLHHYKFVVDNKWVQDPNADAALDMDDGNNRKNSGVDVRPAK